MTSTEATRALSDRPDGWWRSAVIYQIYPRSFSDSDGDGIGDIPGITSRLDYLSALGIDVIWLSPVYSSPQDDNGYDISDYQNIDPLFGSLDDIDELIEQAHARGIKLVMDLVVNHTSDEHDWFIQSRQPGSDKRDWYLWRPARPGFEPNTPGAEPNDIPSAFSGSAWQFDEAGGEYFLHIFSRKQPDLNWENEAVRQAVYAMMRWWVDRGVDGFRMDVINLIAKPPAMLEPGDLSAGWGVNLRLHDFLAEMNREVGLDRLNLITVGEMPGCTIESAKLVTDADRRELNMVFTFEHVDLDVAPGGRGKWDLADLPLPVLKGNLADWQYALADVGWNSLYFANHDQPRSVSRFGDDSAEHRVHSAKTLATVLHLHRGTPYVYQGEELGMTNAGYTQIDQYRDIESVNHYAEAMLAGHQPDDVLHSLSVKSRDNARTPMQWTHGPQAGFTTGDPWLPVHANHVEINAEAAVADEASVFHHLRRLIELRHTDLVVVDGRFELLLPEHPQLWVLTRTLADQVLLVLANCSSTVAELPADGLPSWQGATLLLGTHEDHLASVLQPWESRILRLGSS